MHKNKKKKGAKYKRDIGVYDVNDNLLYTAKDCPSYTEAIKEFEKGCPIYVGEYLIKNI